MKHLVSISIRNISIPNDDERSPLRSKIQSVTSIASLNKNSSNADSNYTTTLHSSPQNAQLTNTSLQISNDPLRNQTSLQQLNDSKIFDTFFSLSDTAATNSNTNYNHNKSRHPLPKHKPFYISEVIENTVSPNFKDITLGNLLIRDPNAYAILAQRTSFKLTIFIRNNYTSKSDFISNYDDKQEQQQKQGKTPWQILLSVQINLGDLVFLGASLNEVDDGIVKKNLILKSHSRRDDCNILLITLADGVYYVPMLSNMNDIRSKLKTRSLSAANGERKNNNKNSNDSSVSVVNVQESVRPTNGVQVLSYDMLMKLNNLKLCILDIEKINHQLATNLENSIKSQQEQATKQKEAASNDDEKSESALFYSKSGQHLQDIALKIRVLKIELVKFRKIVNLFKKHNYNLRKKLELKKTYLNKLRLLIDDSNEHDLESVLKEVNSYEKINFKYIDDDDDDEEEEEEEEKEDIIRNENKQKHDGSVYANSIADSSASFKDDHSNGRQHDGEVNSINHQQHQHQNQNQFNSIILSINADMSRLKEIYGINLNKLNQANYQIDLEILKIFKLLLEIFDIVPNPENPIEFKILGLRLSNLCYFIKYPNYGLHLTHQTNNINNNSHHNSASSNSSIRSYDRSTAKAHAAEAAAAELEDADLHILSKEELQIEIDCALGYVCQLVQLISLYLLIPLKYPIITFGSYSFICDYVSDLNDNSSKVFPLHLMKTNGLIFRFEYGVNLLNKNLEQLMKSQNLSMPDLKNILGNLKTLLLFLSSKDLMYFRRSG